MLIIGLFTWIQLNANPFYFRTYDIEDGLCHNYAFCCAQDSYGFMWFGTKAGLTSFDGKTFYTHKDYSSGKGALISYNILDLEKSPTGQMWVSTDNGVQKYDYQSDSFAPVLDFTKDQSFHALQFDREGNLWMLAYGYSLIKYDEGKDEHTAYMHKGDDPIIAFHITQQGQIWAATARGNIVFLNQDGDGEFTSIGLPPIEGITTLWASPQDSLILIGTTDNGIKRIDLASNTCRDILPSKKEFPLYTRKITQMNDGKVWIGTFNGIYIYDIHTDTLTSIRRDPGNPYSLSNDAIQDIFQDDENGIWICTDNGGISYLPPYSEFEKYYDIDGENTIKGNIIHDICTDHNGNLWIGTEDAGINKFDRKRNAFQVFNDKNGLSQNCIHGLAVIGNKLWIGTHANGIDVMDLRTERITRHYTLSPNAMMHTNNIVVYLYQTRDKQLYVATNLGVYRFNAAEDKFELSPQFPNNCRIQTLFEDHEGTIWAGTVNRGLYYYDPSTGRHGEFKLDSLSLRMNRTVNHIHEDKQHNLWFATGNGVKMYNRKTRQTRQYDMLDGLPSGIIYRIEEDDKGCLWISTANGLACLNPTDHTIKAFKKEHGLTSNQFNYNSSLRASDGTLFFGSLKGMISFRPDDIHEFSVRPKTYISRISYNDPDQNLLHQENIILKKEITLAYNQSTFHIDYISLNYQAPDLTRYAYRMEGLNTEWNQVEGENRIYFTKLPPGTYTFMLKAANLSGIWSEEPATFRIIVLPPWWLSTWACIVYVIIAAGSVILLILFVTRRNKAKMMLAMKEFEDEKEKELYRAKIDFFINIAHEVRTPLTLIKTPLDQLMKDDKLSPNARKYLTIINKNANRLLNLVNQLLDFRKAEAEGNRLNFVETDIIALIHEVCDYFREAAEQKAIRLSIESNEDAFYAYIDKEACTKILSNLLSNAIKYAASLIEIQFKVQNNQHFTIDITNDGEVIPNEHKEKLFEPFFRSHPDSHTGTGLGLPLARSLAEMHGGTLNLSQSTPGLTTFRIDLPVNQPNSLHLQEQDSKKEKKKETEADRYIIHKSRPTILIVEDNAEMLHFIGKEINSLYNVATASNGEEAISYMKGNSIQLIISDIMMPVMDGLTLLKTVKTDLEFSHIPIILLTAKNTLQSRIEGLEQGADAYIDKPFSMDLLLTQVTNLLNNRENMRAYYFNSPIANIKSIAHTKTDEKFLKKLNDIINSHIDDVNLDVDMIADLMNLSRPTLYRKISAISNLTPNELIKVTRLKKAAELIAQGEMKIYEIAEAVGFKSQPYFSQAFSKQFNMSPSQYAKENGQKE